MIIRSFFLIAAILFTIPFILNAETAETFLAKRDQKALTSEQLKIRDMFMRPSSDLKKVIEDIDYSNIDNWFVFGTANSIANYIPNDLKHLELEKKETSVFYIHPSIYWGWEYWNTSLDHSSRLITEDLWLINQASIFAACCNVYAPRYRSANLYSFFDRSGDGSKALLIAYNDVKKAFEEFLRINSSKPFILAGHSQGTFLLNLLIKEFEKTTHFKYLTAAYLIGQDIGKNQYKIIKSCKKPDEKNCYLGWNTTLEKTKPIYSKIPDLLCINPISGIQNEEIVNLSGYMGSMPFGEISTADLKDEEQRQLIYLDGNVQCKDGSLYINNNPLSDFTSRFFNLHSYDYGLFYGNVVLDTLRRTSSSN